MINIGATRWSGLTKSQLILAKFEEKRKILKKNKKKMGGLVRIN
jgi:hypothetical protein